ncbi:MAG: hypothetical protein LBP26_06630 [Clostridiales bacterium]|jgi:hypothetical protein|nr:hypothetical protein [Clostridiales bacterium]
MEEESKSEIESGVATGGLDAGGIVRLTVKTLYRTVVALAFFAALFAVCFPYPAMRFYLWTGLKGRALETAEVIVSRTIGAYGGTNGPPSDSHLADALVTGINLSTEFFNGSAQKNGLRHKDTLFYAKKIIKYADAYNSFSTLNIRSELIDADSLRRSPKWMHGNVYSYLDDVMCAREKARFASEGINPAFGDFSIDLNNLQTFFPLDDGKSSDADKNMFMDRYSRIFNRFAAVLEAELRDMGYYNIEFTANGLPTYDAVRAAELPFSADDFKLLFLRDSFSLSADGTPSYVNKSVQLLRLEEFAPKIFDYMYAYNPETSAGFARKLYWARSLVNLTVRVREALGVMQVYSAAVYHANQYAMIDGIVENWDALMTMDGENGKPLVNVWYHNVLVPEYLNAN